MFQTLECPTCEFSTTNFRIYIAASGNFMVECASLPYHKFSLKEIRELAKTKNNLNSKRTNSG